MVGTYTQDSFLNHFPKAVDINCKWIVRYQIPAVVKFGYCSVASIRMCLRGVRVVWRASTGHSKVDYVILWGSRCTSMWFFDLSCKCSVHVWPHNMIWFWPHLPCAHHDIRRHQVSTE